MMAVYTRVSAQGDRDEERFHSHKEQEERARAFAEAKGWAVAPHVYSDNNVSGAVHPEKRPAMGELLARIRAGELGGVVAFSIDRLSREPAHGDWLIAEVTAAGGVVSAPDIPEDVTSPTGEFQFAILLSVARLYRRTAGARFASAKERAILAGIPVGPVPIGYRQRADRRLEVDPDTAPVVREVFERRAAGEGYTALARLLDKATDRVWSKEAVPNIIARRLYATGRLEYGGIVSDHEAGAIVEEPLFYAAQRAEPRPRPRRSPNSPWILTGLLRCGSCGHAMLTARSSKKEANGGQVRRRYACRHRACTARVSVHAGRVETWVALQSFAVGDEIATRADAPDLGALEAEVATAERRLEHALSPGMQDDLGEAWGPTVKDRRQERDEALARLGEARQEAGVEAADFRLRDVWADLSMADRREALALFWTAIYVGRRTKEGTPLRFVARGPGAEVEVALPGKEAK
jgi:DNA invertase Pin-like site-specific DNA recombinase